MKQLIIDKPGLQSARQRVLYGSMTVLFWALWIYLWLPVLAVVGWVLGLRIAYFQMVVLNGYAGLLHLLRFYLTVIAGLGGSLLIWAYYNFFRFRGTNRRSHVPKVGVDETSRHYGIDPAVVAGWIDSRRVTLYHDANGKLLAHPPGRAEAATPAD